MGRMAWNILFLAVLALPPAESPSTMKISHLEGSFDSQFASFPLESKENFCFVSMFVRARSSLFRIFAAFSAQEMILFRVSTFLSKKRVISSPVILLTTLEAS